MKTPTKDYKPYGDEWKKHVMQMSKSDIVELFAGACTSKDSHIEILENALNVVYEVAKSCDGHVYLKENQINELKRILMK